MRRASWVLLILSFSLCICAPLFAQKYNGTITGTVTDPQGAVVSGAQVTAANQATGESRTTTTSPAGVYVFPDEPAGAYTVTVKSPNFKDFVAKGVELNVSSTATVNAALVVGTAGEQVTVEASTVQVETSGGQVGNVVEGNEVRELPLNGRNFIELTQLAPGVSPIAGFNVVKKGLEGGVDFSVNGNNVTGNLFLVDGVNNNDIGSNRTILIYPSIQAIDEFKILRNSYGPEYGQASGAIINIVTRSGSNQFHGGVFYDGRNDVLNANSFFNNLNGAKRPPLHRNDYGFNIGGPVIKDKLFFFESEEWNKEKRGNGRFAQVPNAAERTGDFSQLNPGVDAHGNACDPAPTINGAVVTSIPAGQLSTSGQAMTLTYPLPNLNAPNCINWGGNFSSPVPWREDNVRVDFNVTPTWKLMGRYTNDDWTQPYPSTLSYWGDDIYPTIEGGWYQPGRQATVKLTKLIGATAVNDLQLSFAMNRITVQEQGTGANGMTPLQLQEFINNASPTFFPYSTKFGGIQGTGQPLFWSAINQTQHIEGGPSGGFTNQGPWHNNEQLLILKDDFSKVFGVHTFKAGFIATSNQKNEEFDNSSGFNGDYWSTASAGNVNAGSAGCKANPASCPGSSGNGMFDLLWNQQTWGGSENNTTPYAQLRWHDYEFYAGDSWKIRRNVTLEVGARYSFLRNVYDGDNKYSNWQPAFYNSAIGGTSPCNGLITTSVGISACNTLANTLGVQSGATLYGDRSLRKQDNHMIAPRVGIAWDVRGDGKTAVRAGFGTFYLRDAVGPLEGGTNNPPFILGVGFQRPLDVAPAPGSLTASGTPGRSFLLTTQNPYTNQWNLTIEREVFTNTKLELAYVGNKGFDLRDFADQNYIPAGKRVAFAEASSGGSFRPFGTGNWGAIYQEQWHAYSNYNALQALFRTRVKAVDAQFAYTWSKSLSNTDISDSSGGQNALNSYIDPLNPRLDYGPTQVNRPHMLVGNIVYNAPAFAGQSAPVRHVLGNWELSSILSYASGPSLTVLAGSVGAPGGLVGAGTSQGNDRPNLVAGQSCRASGNAINWLNPNKFTLDHYVLGQNPTSPRGVCAGPGNAQTDFSVAKNFKITERVNAKFSMDFFNLFNKTQFIATSINTNLSGAATLCDAATPCAGYANDTIKWSQANIQGNFGQETAAKDPRQIQYNLRIEF
jgi:hypothetical protein